MFLIVKEGDEVGRAYKLSEGNTIVGRNPSCQIALSEDSAVSRQHLRFTRKPDGTCTATDLNSTNGSYLNGRRMLPNVLSVIEPGATLLIGTTLFELVLHHTPVRKPPMPHPVQPDKFDIETLERRSDNTDPHRAEKLSTDYLENLPD
jgi:pSer/pThr/pTyr-binding forkhead associated (FHA) protein